MLFPIAALLAASITPTPSFSDPALSPDHSEIAFVSGGDIWTVPAKGGVARLLVSHPATESRPLYSPDGTQLAFTSTRTGNGDIYVLTLATGQLARLTYSDTLDLLDGWSRDGKWLYFSSSVNDIGFSNDIFRVSVDGGTPLEVTRERFYNEFRGAPSPDGTQLAFVAKGMSSAQWWRHGHAHIDEAEIWIKGIAEGGPYKRVVTEDAKQGWPMWSDDGRALFYTSDRTGAENIFRQSLDNSPLRQLTRFTDGRLLWPSISYDGREIVFERDLAIWTLDTKTGKTAKVPIVLHGSTSTPAVTHQQVTSFTDLALSPDGKKVAVIAHGDVFAASAADGGEAIRLTRTPAPETGLQWSPDSKQVVYVSLRNGHEQLFEYDLVKNSERQLTNTNQDDEAPRFSPDGKLLAFVRGEQELRVLELANNKDRALATGFIGLLGQPALAWSPDNKFLAYASMGAKSFRNVNVVPAAGGASQPVSFLANGETASQIAWSPDGKYLLFDTAQRSEQSHMARVDLIPHLPKFREDQFRDLFKTNPPENTPAKPAETTAAKSPAKNETPAPASKTEPVRIDFAGIRDRLTLMPLGYTVEHPIISPDGKQLVFAAITGTQTNLYSYPLDELATTPPSVHQLTSTSTPKSHYQFTPDSKSIYFLDAGHVVSIPLDTHTPKTIAVTASLDVDFDAEKMAAFEQGWDILNNHFYDPKFNGHDWSQLRDTYTPYIEGSRTPDEMRRVMSLMIGELNSSHSGVSGPRPTPQNATPFSPMPTPVGRLGLRFEREPYEAGKGLVIREVIPLGPAALEGSIKAGEILLAVDGELVGPRTNLDHLLENKVDRRVVLQIGDAANPAHKRDAIVRPVQDTTEAGLLYRSWVEANRAYVERISGGKLGYVHLADMSQQSLTQLYIDLDVQNQTKQGVVIDLRDNYGGFVNEYALDVFTRKNYLTMTPRGGSAAPARPFLGQRSLGLPTILVTNQDSLSDAEDFTEGYRALKLGKVVGEPTAGWIIYTGGTQLIDGTLLRIPMIRVQDHNGENMEMHPRPVDIPVERLPGECLHGKDHQLDRAVEELLSQVSHPGGV
ncbi:MAG TPA: S41 family peptidase [Bryobacteraceae bacterium]|nr:S41 family peptidase [Bryobacteraceae bacterium]